MRTALDGVVGMSGLRNGESGRAAAAAAAEASAYAAMIGPESRGIAVRRMRPGDDVAAIVIESEPRVYARMFGSLDRAREMMADLVQVEGHVCGVDVAWVAEDDGDVVGFLSGFPVREAERRERAVIERSFAALSWFGRLRFRACLMAADSIHLAPPGDGFYVDTLAVAESARGRGAGRGLIEAAIDEGRRTRCARVVLDTTTDNDGARAFYAACGFREGAVRHAPPLARRACGMPGLVALARDLRAHAGADPDRSAGDGSVQTGGARMRSAPGRRSISSGRLDTGSPSP